MGEHREDHADRHGYGGPDELDLSGYAIGGAQARVSRNANQTISTGTSWTAITFTTEDIDTGTFIDIGGAPTKITVPTTGNYLIGFGVTWGVISGGLRDARIRVNGSGSVICRDNFTPGGGTYEVALGQTMMHALVAGDYLELEVRQDSGSNVSIIGINGQDPAMWVYGPL